MGVGAWSAARYDPATDAWEWSLPLPEPRAGGAAVALADGSMLVIGGYDPATGRYAEPGMPFGLSSIIRFVPGP